MTKISQRTFSRAKDHSSCLPRALNENQYCYRNAYDYSTDYWYRCAVHDARCNTEKSPYVEVTGVIRSGFLKLPLPLYGTLMTIQCKSHLVVHWDIVPPKIQSKPCPVGCFHSIPKMICDGADWDSQIANSWTQQPQLSLVHCIHYH